MANPIDHIALLVPDLEEAIERWTRVTGFEFGPIVRYRTAHYVDHSSSDAHHHNARIANSLQGAPRLELMEITGDGTHSAAQAGVHHIGFLGYDDITGQRDAIRALGLGVDGESYLDDGALHLFFTEKADMDGMRIEFCSTTPGPMVADDGSALK